MCYEHDGGSPTLQIKVDTCDDPDTICDILKHDLAWVDTNKQHWSYKGNQRS